MMRALAGHPNQPFEAPDGIVFVDIDRDTGKLADAGLPADLPRGLPRRDRADRDRARSTASDGGRRIGYESPVYTRGAAASADSRTSSAESTIRLCSVTLTCAALCPLRRPAGTCLPQPARSRRTAQPPAATRRSAGAAPAAPAGRRPGAAEAGAGAAAGRARARSTART